MVLDSADLKMVIYLMDSIIQHLNNWDQVDDQTCFGTSVV